MGYSSAAAALAYSPGSRMEPHDLITHLAPGDMDVIRLRFLPLSYLTCSSIEWDRGIDQLVYVQSLIDEEE